MYFFGVGGEGSCLRCVEMVAYVGAARNRVNGMVWENCNELTNLSFGL